MKCLNCDKDAGKNTRKHLITRYGEDKKYCSSKCLKAYWAKENKDKNDLSKQKWIDNNPDKRKEASDTYRRSNTEYYAQYSSLRTRYLQHAKPGWVDEEALLEFYILAKELGLEVDHIVPLKHDRVCGLHVPWNLQLLTRSENAKKSNKFTDEDVVAISKEA